MVALPGFPDPVYDAQRTFRALLDALSRPGQPQPLTLPAAFTPPPGLTMACAAACLTLLDLETPLWLAPPVAPAVRDWLVFHTGCPLVNQPASAAFALVTDAAALPPLDQFSWGTATYPEAATTLLGQLPALAGGPKVTLAGPGIVETISCELPLPPDFWPQWQAMTRHYPLGLDGWWFAANQGVGLPRTARVVDLSLER